MIPPAETQVLLDNAGFANVIVDNTGAKYLAAYKAVIEKAEQGQLPPLGIHLLMGESALQKTRNAARNIEERRTHPIQVIGDKPIR